MTSFILAIIREHIFLRCFEKQMYVRYYSTAAEFFFMLKVESSEDKINLIQFQHWHTVGHLRLFAQPSNATALPEDSGRVVTKFGLFANLTHPADFSHTLLIAQLYRDTDLSRPPPKGRLFSDFQSLRKLASLDSSCLKNRGFWGLWKSVLMTFWVGPNSLFTLLKEGPTS